ncbi:hypothetical protein OHS18_39685 [Amycolatopsis sp. NBC_00355]|uniref:hypothetical protein n=1 Tax=Amycolatopsis sp. NBC_00355 TaxID=2975957 RepID=UPI002E263BE0
MIDARVIRAVADGARRTFAVPRRPAGQGSALDGLDPSARRSADRLRVALGADATNLPPARASGP